MMENQENRFRSNTKYNKVQKRLQTEIMGLVMNGIKGIKAFPERNNILDWKAEIICPKDSLYPGSKFTVKIEIPLLYPYESPEVYFIGLVPFHPNVDKEGTICLDILKDNWTPVYNVRTLLLSIQQLLEDPNDADPLCIRAAEVYGRGRDFFIKFAKKLHKLRSRKLRSLSQVAVQ